MEARARGYSFAGEMFSAKNLAALATELYGSKVKIECLNAEWDDVMIKKMLIHIGQGNTILVPFVAFAITTFIIYLVFLVMLDMMQIRIQSQ